MRTAACWNPRITGRDPSLYQFGAARLQEHDADSSADDSNDEDLSEEETEGLHSSKKRRLSGAKQLRRGVNRRLCQQVLCRSLCFILLFTITAE